jgi:hypothetical protein
MASASRPSSSPRRQRKSGILLGAAGHVGQLLLARILVALHVQGADLQALQIAQQLLVLLQAQPHLRGHLASPGARPIRAVSTRMASSTARPLRRSSRGLQSSVRRLSRIAPRMRNCA